ncbi:aquaporin-1-like [Neoarius graeffei]|uniref:aquaporin-1-like n=1 Tax=Neoarius graeffei TaxID=443677 RepID=UPI00298CF3F9|nr:aquaporin-1-like [Neoarius graeffei]
MVDLKPVLETLGVRRSCRRGFWRAALAELIGTTMLVFCGVSAAIGNGNSSYPDQEVKVAFGLAIAILAQSLGHISEAHLNPAVTLAMLVSCQISMCRALWYILAQVTGVVIASGIVLGVRPSVVDSLGLNKLKDASPGQGFGIEFLLTFQLVLCVLAMMDKRQDKIAGSAPFACGLSVVLAAPNFSLPFKLEVDASASGASAVLLQDGDDSVCHPVCYFSVKFKCHQLSYSTIEKETLAMLLALQHFEGCTTITSG